MVCVCVGGGGSSHSATSTHTQCLSKLKNRKKCSQGLCRIPLHEHKQTDQKAILEGGVEGGGGTSRKSPLKTDKEERGKRKQEGKQTELKNQSDSTTDNERII